MWGIASSAQPEQHSKMCLWCLHIGCSHPGERFREAIASNINILFCIVMGNKTNIGPRNDTLQSSVVIW